MIINISKSSYLAAIQLFTAKNDVRYYLAGVCISRHPEEGILLVSTDGHYLAVIHDKQGSIIFDDTEEKTKWAGRSIIIEFGSHSLKHMKLTKYVNERACLTIANEARPPLDDVTTQFGNSPVSCDSKTIDGAFPDWKRLIPADLNLSDTNMEGCIDARLLHSFTSAAMVLEGKAPTLKQKTASPVVFTQPDKSRPVCIRFTAFPEFFGLVMPLRNQKDFRQIPEWLKK